MKNMVLTRKETIADKKIEDLRIEIIDRDNTIESLRQNGGAISVSSHQRLKSKLDLANTSIH